MKKRFTEASIKSTLPTVGRSYKDIENNLWKAWKKAINFVVSPWQDDPTKSSTAQDAQQFSNPVQEQPRPLSPMRLPSQTGSLRVWTPSTTASYTTSTEDLPASIDAECALTKGPVRVVTANDGEEDCIALLLSKDLVECLNDVLQGRDRVDRLQENSDACRIRFGTTQIYAQNSQIEIEKLETALKAAQHSSGSGFMGVHDELEELKTSLVQFENDQEKFRSKKEQADEALKYERIYQRGRSDKFLGIMSGALDERQLIDHTASIVDHSIEEEADGDIQNPGDIQHTSSTSSTSSDVLGLEELNIAVVKQTYINATDNLRYLQGEFDERKGNYCQQMMDYNIEKENGECESVRMTELDNRFLYGSMMLTKALREAEVAFEEARNDIDAFGINLAGVTFMNSTMTLPDSDFQEIEGVHPAQEVQAIASCPRGFIECWIDMTLDAGNLGPDEVPGDNYRNLDVDTGSLEPDEVAEDIYREVDVDTDSLRPDEISEDTNREVGVDEDDGDGLDNWDVEPLCPEDSISCVAEPGYFRDRIDRWQDIRGEGVFPM